MRQVACDVLVAGSGAAGLACAFAAQDMGLNVIVVEKSDRIGGTTAWSGGEIWVPCNSQQAGARITDSKAEAIRYLELSAEGRADPLRIGTYVSRAAEALDYFLAKGAMQVEVMPDAPDYFDNRPGAHKGGRTLRMVPFDGRKLGPDFRRLRDPLAAGQIFGGLSVAREDIGHLQAMGRAPRSMLYVLRLLLAHGLQRLGGLHRGARTTMGNALVARFMAALAAQGVPIWCNAALTEVKMQAGRVIGAIVSTDQGPVEVTAARGVVLATGGFSHDLRRQAQVYPHVAAGRSHFALPPKDVAGDGLTVALRVGGTVRDRASEPAAWTAVSERRQGDKVWQVPHFGDKAKPGIIAVLPDGRRFANEASNYHDFCRALIDSGASEAWLIADHRALRRYGLGRVGPFPAPLGSHLRCGYLIRGTSLESLAQATGIEARALMQTVARFNAMALQGVDADFHRGGSAFDRAAGDPDQHPNPTMAPLVKAPFYAIRIVPGNLSTFLGLDTDATGAVLNAEGQAIPGLFALGADAEAVTGGSYPAAGITLGPAMTFAWCAARAMATDCAVQTNASFTSSARTA
jgi:succinate dehydrogenase/fumarate reductase flavoprotein subunit